MYEALLYVLIGSGALVLIFVGIRFVALSRLYDVSKPNHFRIAGRFYDSFHQLDRDIALDFRLWRNPDLIRLADPHQRQYLARIRRWGMAGFLAVLTFALGCIFALISMVGAVGE